MTGAIAYCALFAVGLLAFCGLPWYVLLAGAAVLVTLSLLEHLQYLVRPAGGSMVDLIHTAVMASVGNALLASIGAYAVGYVVRAVFGG
jgi:hypothetical protein